MSLPNTQGNETMGYEDESERLPFAEGARLHAQVLADVDSGDLMHAWEAFQEWNDQADESDFAWFVDGMLNESILQCSDCADWTSDDDATTVNEGNDTVCESCRDYNYTVCVNCCGWIANNNTRDHDGDTYCDDCFGETFSYCEHCDEYVPVDGHDFEHEDEQCDCVAPLECFIFPANGHGTIEQDERLTVELPAGTIDEEGLRRITRLVINSLGDDDRSYDRWFVVPTAVESIGAQWQTKRGNFTRRLSSALYSSHKIKLADGVLSEVGNLARAHSSNGASWDVEVTRDLNLSAADFYHEGSCWWGGYGYSRCALKSWGGLAIRTFDGTRYHNVSGRAWIQPLQRDDDGNLVPTHDTMGAVAYLVYNGYGNLEGYVAARIVAHLSSLSYKKIRLSINRQYVNGNTSFLVADEATCADVESLSFDYVEHDTQDASSFTKVYA